MPGKCLPIAASDTFLRGLSPCTSAAAAAASCHPTPAPSSTRSSAILCSALRTTFFLYVCSYDAPRSWLCHQKTKHGMAISSRFIFLFLFRFLFISSVFVFVFTVQKLFFLLWFYTCIHQHTHYTLSLLISLLLSFSPPYCRNI